MVRKNTESKRSVVKERKTPKTSFLENRFIRGQTNRLLQKLE